jgi:hypothetical protein
MDARFDLLQGLWAREQQGVGNLKGARCYAAVLKRSGARWRNLAGNVAEMQFDYCDTQLRAGLHG